MKELMKHLVLHWQDELVPSSGFYYSKSDNVFSTVLGKSMLKNFTFRLKKCPTFLTDIYAELSDSVFYVIECQAQLCVINDDECLFYMWMNW